MKKVYHGPTIQTDHVNILVFFFQASPVHVRIIQE